MSLQNLTNSTNGPSRRRYDDACGTAHALDLIGERWALLVLGELMLGPKRFSDIRADLPGISANTLTQRLEGLEASGLVVRRRLTSPTDSSPSSRWVSVLALIPGRSARMSLNRFGPSISSRMTSRAQRSPIRSSAWAVPQASS